MNVLSLWQTYIPTLIFRSSIHCSSMCISTQGCSAFLFNNQNNICQIGSNVKLLDQNSISPNNELLAINSLENSGIPLPFLKQLRNKAYK